MNLHKTEEEMIAERYFEMRDNYKEIPIGGYMSDGMTDMLEEEGRPSKVHLSSIQMAAMQKTDKVTQAAYLKAMQKEASDGTTASYYELPEDATELQDLISAKNMNAQIGEIFRECYRYGQASHSDEIRGIKKILFYAKAELERLQNL